MGELNERIWSVISERGCERSGLGYAQAARLMRKLAKEKARGLCVVTDAAARHLAPVNPAPSRRRRASKSPAPKSEAASS